MLRSQSAASPGVLARTIRLCHTVRHLRTEQVYGRLIHRLHRPRVRAGAPPCARAATGPWVAPIEKPRSVFDGLRARFLNVEAPIAGEGIWNDSGKAKLWLYNLHYFDDLAGPHGTDGVRGAQSRLVARWIAENPPGAGNGWESYPVSLRIVNWIKWRLAGAPAQPQFDDSLALQARWLARRLEWHLLGNHLLANAKALVFAGLYFEGAEADAWLRQGTAIYARELPEQILDDGGHFELSPMYHAIILEDLLDVLNLARRYGAAVTDGLGDLPAVTTRMRQWFAAMTHPDGGLSYFNDSTFGVAPTRAELEAYAARLSLPASPPPGAGVHHLAASGYVRVNIGDCAAVLDVAAVGPDYIPGHAHADTLSFELSLRGHRLVVNSGTSTYAPGARREAERATRAHSTVEVDGENSSEVWGAFRVGRRARIRDLAIEVSKNAIDVRALHDGYKTCMRGPLHRRHWRFEGNGLVVEDHLVGPPAGRAVARVFLAPAVGVASDAAGSRLTIAEAAARVRADAPVTVARSHWHSGFGESQANHVLEAMLRDGRLRMQFEWE